jgi:hypothetical protein
MIHSNVFASSHRESLASYDPHDLPERTVTGIFNGTQEQETPRGMHTRREWTGYELYAFIKERQTLMGTDGDPVPTPLRGMNIDSKYCPVSVLKWRTLDGN